MQSLLTSVMKPVVAGSLSAPLSPVLANGLFGWFDMSDLSTITEVGGQVSQIDDKSGAGNHVLQATGADQPLTGTRKRNSLNVLEWQDANMNLQSPVLTGGVLNDALTVFCVAEFDDATSGNRRFYTLTNASSNNRAQYKKRNNANNNTLRIRNGSNITSVVSADERLRFMTAIFDGVNSVAFRDREVIATGDTGGGDPTADGILLGAGSGPTGNNFDGSYGEFLAYEGRLSPELIELNWQYLEGKWAL